MGNHVYSFHEWNNLNWWDVWIITLSLGSIVGTVLYRWMKKEKEEE